MKILASGGAVRWWTIAFLIFAHAAVCLPIDDFSLRTSPCQLLALATDTEERSPATKPVVKYTLEGSDASTTINAVASVVCKGTVTLRLGTVLDVLVFVHSDATQNPLYVLTDTSVEDNETVQYTCPDASTGCAVLINRASTVATHHGQLRRSARQMEHQLTLAGPSLLASTLPVIVAMASLLGLTAALALCAKSSASYDPIPLPATNTGADVQKGTAETKQVTTASENSAIKLSGSTASDNAPLLPSCEEADGSNPVETTPTADETSSSPTAQVIVVTNSLTHQVPSEAHPEPGNQQPPASDSTHSVVVEPAHEIEAKPHIAAQNMVVEDGFPYASVSSATSKAETTSNPTQTTAPAATDSKLEPTKTETVPLKVMVEDGFPYASVSSGTSSKAESTLDPSRAVDITTNKLITDGFPYASVSDKTTVPDSKSSRHRSSSSSEIGDTVGPIDSSKNSQRGRARSVTTPESLGIAPSSGPSVRLSTHQPLPAIPRQPSDLFDEVYDIIPESPEDGKVDTSVPRPRVYDSLPENEKGPDEMYESVPDQLKMLDLARPTPSPPGSPKAGGFLSPKKGSVPEGRRRAFTFFQKKKKDSIDDHSPSSPPHHTAPSFPPPLPPTDHPIAEASSPHKQVEKTMSLPAAMRGVGLAGVHSDRAHLPLPELPDDSGSGSNAAVVGPKPRTLEPDDPRYDLVPTGEESRGKEEEPGYDTVKRMLNPVEEDSRSIDLSEALDEPGYDSVKREDILKLQGIQDVRKLEDDPAYDKVKNEGAGQVLDVAEEPGYAKVDKELIEAILASHQNQAGDQVPAEEVITLGYAKVTKDPTLSSTELQHDEMGYAVVPSDGKLNKKEESSRAPPIPHDEQGYAIVPSDLKEARRSASQKKTHTGQLLDETSLAEQPSEGHMLPSDKAQLSLHPAVTQSKPSLHTDTLYSKVDVELKHELRKQRHSYHEDTSELLSPVPSSPHPDRSSPDPTVPPPPSSAAAEFPDLNSPPVPLQSDVSLQLVVSGEPPYAAVNKSSVSGSSEGEAGYAEVGTHRSLAHAAITTNPSQEGMARDVALGYATVTITTAHPTQRDVDGYDVVGNVRTTPTVPES